jgi:hypothetical protein
MFAQGQILCLPGKVEYAASRIDPERIISLRSGHRPDNLIPIQSYIPRRGFIYIKDII